MRAGERVAADGAIVSGASAIDESSITGEPLPREKDAGDEVFSGSLNGAGLLEVQVTRAGSDTTLARVVKLVQEAQQRRAPVERLADRAAQYFLPALLLAAALTYYFTARLDAHGGGADRGLPVRPDSGHAHRHGRGNRRPGPPRYSGARRAHPAARGEGGYGGLR